MPFSSIEVDFPLLLRGFETHMSPFDKKHFLFGVDTVRHALHLTAFWLFVAHKSKYFYVRAFLRT